MNLPSDIVPQLRRVAFCGASGTGKTTLAKRLAEHYGLPLSPSMAREAAKDAGLASPYDSDHIGEVETRRVIPGATMSRVNLQRAIVHRRIAWQDDHRQGFVSDRTSFDDLAYSLMHGLSGRTYQELADAVILQWSRLAPTYDRVVLCPVASFWRHGADVARVDDLSYHVRFEALLLELLRAASVPVDLSLARVSDRKRGVWLAKEFGVRSAAFQWP